MSKSNHVFRTPYTQSSDALRRNIFFLFIIFFTNPVWSEISDYYIQGPSWYVHSTQDSAQAECVGLGMSLCSPEQLYRLVFEGVDSEAQIDLHFAGYTNAASDSPYHFGWFSTQEGDAATNWLPAWAAALTGAHCCSEFDGTTFEACSDYTCGDGTILVDGSDNVFCAGSCDSNTCCAAWTPAPSYRTIWGSYKSIADANQACQDLHTDLFSCTAEQLQGVAVAGEQICSSGWYRDGIDTGVRGWYVNQEWADQGGCDGIAEWRTWALEDGTGTAHCCAPSYHNGGYGILSEQTLEAAEAYCASTVYTPTLCTQGQVTTITSIEQENLCISGWTSNAGIGWYVNDNWAAEGGCDGLGGWRTWASPSATAHCCAEYVYEPDLGDFGSVPGTYAESTLTDGASAEAFCVQTGYDGLCTQGQVAWVGTYDVVDMCVVGWASDGAGGYVTPGYYNTIAAGGCGQPETWNDGWQPANAVAHCCMADVPEVSLATPPYKNGNWDYSYATMEAAAAMCSGEYSLCSKAQVFTIATQGVLWDDGVTLQLEPSICRAGWVSDGEAGWWQTEEVGGCGTVNSWNTFNSAVYTYHCCKDFVALDMAPAVPVAFTSAEAGYTLTSEAEALAACQSIESEYTLCTASQVVHAARYGVSGDGENWLDVEAQPSLCKSGWVSSDSVCDKTVGWFQVEEGCGTPALSWNGWSMGGLSDAWCCSPTFDLGEEEYAEELGCVMEPPEPIQVDPTASPSKYPVSSEPSKTPSSTMPSSTPSTELPTTSPSTATSTLCQVGIKMTPSNFKDSDEAFARSIQGVWIPTGVTEGIFFLPSNYERTYQPGVDRELIYDPNAPANAQWSMDTDYFSASAGGGADENDLSWSWAGDSGFGANVIVDMECVDELPPYQKMRDCDAAAIASVGILKEAMETYESKTANGVFTPIDSITSFVGLLAVSHIKYECQSLFASWLDSNGDLDVAAVENFMAGNTDGAAVQSTSEDVSCLPEGFDITAEAPAVTDEIWGTCAGTTNWSNQGRLCGIWTLIFGATTCRENAGSTDGSELTVETINSFMGYFVGDYAENGCGDSLAASMSNAPAFSVRRSLQQKVDTLYYADLLNDELANIKTLYPEVSVDAYYFFDTHPPEEMCVGCLSSEARLLDFFSAFYAPSTYTDAEVENLVSVFNTDEQTQPTVQPSPDSCPAVVLWQQNGATPYDGIYNKLSVPRNTKVAFEWAEKPGWYLQWFNNEVWEVHEEANVLRTISFTSATQGFDDLPPDSDTWQLCDNVNPVTVGCAVYHNVSVACDEGNEYSVGGSITGLELAGESVTLFLGSQTLTLTSSQDWDFIDEFYHNHYYYDVTFTTTPGINCTMTGGSGQIEGWDVTNVDLVCEIREFTIGGTATGVQEDYAVYVDLIYTDSLGVNQTETVQLETHTSGVSPYVFNSKLMNGNAYYVSINEDLTNIWYECSLTGADPVGAISGESVANMNIVCGEQTYSVGGEVLFPSQGTITLQLWINFTDDQGNNASVLVDQAYLEDYYNLGGADWTFHTELSLYSDWYVVVSSISNSHTYIECTSGPWSDTDIDEDVDWIKVSCSEGDELCLVPDWLSNITDSGYPEMLLDSLTMCGDEYYYNSEPTCIGGSPTPTETCQNDLVCMGTIGRYFGTVEEQVMALQEVLGFEEGCLANGATCGIDHGTACCDPYAACYWTVEGFDFMQKCILHSDAQTNLNDYIAPAVMSFEHGACPPMAEECTTLTTTYALPPLDTATTGDTPPEPVVEYCRGADGIYYMNGISTCQNTTDALTDTYIGDFAFGMESCVAEEFVRPFEVLVDDNLYVINSTTEYYQDIVDNAIADCCLEYDDYSSYLTTWESNIGYINSQKSHYTGTDIEAEINSIIDLATSILSQLQEASTSD